MTERALWRSLRRGMGRRWHATRHEDVATPGIPDVSYSCQGYSGWIELKVCVMLGDAMVHPRVRATRFTFAQRRFLRDRGAQGADTWLLIAVENADAFLIRGHWASRIEWPVAVADLRRMATATWSWPYEFDRGLEDSLTMTPTRKQMEALGGLRLDSLR